MLNTSSFNIGISFLILHIIIKLIKLIKKRIMRGRRRRHKKNIGTLGSLSLWPKISMTSWCKISQWLYKWKASPFIDNLMNKYELALIIIMTHGGLCFDLGHMFLHSTRWKPEDEEDGFKDSGKNLSIDNWENTPTWILIEN